MDNKDKKNWGKWWFWIAIILLLIILLFIGTDAQNEEMNNGNNLENLNISNIATNQKEKNSEYADDIVINNFIRDFKTVSSYELTNVQKGNIRTKYFVNINGQYCQLLNATDSEANYFEIIINGGKQKDDVDKIIDVYKEVIKTLDSTIMESQIDDTVSTYISSQNVSTTFNINDKIIVKFYPSISLSYGNSDCRIEITTNYN